MGVTRGDDGAMRGGGAGRWEVVGGGVRREEMSLMVRYDVMAP
jgi:hypothetical protein